MARSFSRGARSQRRRTNWIAAATTDRLDAAAETAEYNAIIDMTDPDGEIGKYVDPTLVRIRGQILVDPVMASASSGSEFVSCWFALSVGPNAPLWVATGEGQSEFWSNDRIIWSGCVGFSKNTGVVAGADSEGHLVYALRHDALEVDVKAMRKLGDDQSVWLTAINTVGSNISFEYRYMLRCLVME